MPASNPGSRARRSSSGSCVRSAAVEVKQVERVEDDAVVGVRVAVLQRLERRADLRVDGHDLAVDHGTSW